MKLSLVPLRPESNDLLHLDCLRFIAANGIVILHLSSKVRWGIGGTPELAGLNQFVDLFFAISGFVIAYVYDHRIRDLRSFGWFIQNRIARLVPLHWAMLLFFWCLGAVAASKGAEINHPEVFDSSCFWPNVFLLQATPACSHLSYNTPAWSISSEFVMYAITPVILWAARRSVAAVVLFAASLIVLFTYMTGSHWLDWTAPFGPLRALPSYLLGVSAFRMRASIRLRNSNMFMFVTLAVMLAFMVTGANAVVVLALAYIVFLFAVCADQSGLGGRLVRMMAAAGQLTYSSYMIHLAVILVMMTVIGEKFLHLQAGAENALAAVTYFVIWISAYLSLIYFEHPMRRLLRKPFGPYSEKRRSAGDIPLR